MLEKAKIYAIGFSTNIYAAEAKARAVIWFKKFRIADMPIIEQMRSSG